MKKAHLDPFGRASGPALRRRRSWDDHHCRLRSAQGWGNVGRPTAAGRNPMATESKDKLITELDRVARETFAYFEGPGRRTDARVDRWQARDVLQHFIYF